MAHIKPGSSSQDSNGAMVGLADGGLQCAQNADRHIFTSRACSECNSCAEHRGSSGQPQAV